MAPGEFIETNKDRPYFAYSPYFAIHSPLQSRNDVLAKFAQKQPGKLYSNSINAALWQERLLVS